MQKEHPQVSLSIEIVIEGLFTRVHKNVQGIEGAPPKIPVNRNCHQGMIHKSPRKLRKDSMQKEHPQRSLSIETVIEGLFTRVHKNVQGFHVAGAPPKIPVNRSCNQRIIHRVHTKCTRIQCRRSTPKDPCQLELSLKGYSQESTKMYKDPMY